MYTQLHIYIVAFQDIYCAYPYVIINGITNEFITLGSKTVCDKLKGLKDQKAIITR